MLDDVLDPEQERLSASEDASLALPLGDNPWKELYWVPPSCNPSWKRSCHCPKSLASGSDERVRLWVMECAEQKNDHSPTLDWLVGSPLFLMHAHRMCIISIIHEVKSSKNDHVQQNDILWSSISFSDRVSNQLLRVINLCMYQKRGSLHHLVNLHWVWITSLQLALYKPAGSLPARSGPCDGWVSLTQIYVISTPLRLYSSFWSKIFSLNTRREGTNSVSYPSNNDIPFTFL